MSDVPTRKSILKECYHDSISAVLLTLSAVFWVNMFIAAVVGLLDKDDLEKDEETE